MSGTETERTDEWDRETKRTGDGTGELDRDREDRGTRTESAEELDRDRENQ